MTGARSLLVAALAASSGFVAGVSLVYRADPMPGVALQPARNPLNPKELAGMLTAAGIRHLAGHLEALPRVVLETEKTVVLSTSRSASKVHYVLFPKKDIKNLGTVSAVDQAYLMDVFVVARRLTEREKLSDYRFYTNGPGYQTVAYLHFHLVGRRGH
jgi:diadenosine tetraphosphate (Ap4A) HIT family hydrolase